MGIKSTLRPLVHALAWRTGLSGRLARRQNQPRILMFHGIGGPDCPAELFRATLEFLKRDYSIVPLAQIVSRFKNGAGRDNREVALTFDDGLRNNHLVAHPLLQHYEAPATFFVCPGLIGTGRWLWNQEARQRLRSLPAPARQQLADDLAVPGSGVETIVEWMKRQPLNRRQPAEERIRQQTPDYQPMPEEHQQCDLMDWQELAALDKELISIGSHTSTHSILTSLRPEELRGEIDGSRQLLESRLGRPVTHFCYPNGYHNEAAVRQVRGVYDAAVTTEGRLVRPEDDPCLLPRIGAAENLAHLAWRMHRPTS